MALRKPDDASWRRYGVSGWTDRGAWRRASIDDFVRIYAEVKAPSDRSSGISIPSGGRAMGWRQGLDAYTEIFADARWLLRLVDYLLAALLLSTTTSSSQLDAWWRGENVLGRHLCEPLHDARRLAYDPWPAEEIAEGSHAARGPARDG
jgi:hypothetical protein